jgi:prepilin-type N-terminal cleavage/methylation domain-containing protein
VARNAKGWRNAARGGFSLVEMLVALVISATLLTATMVALDVMFKRYTAISDSASTHVIARTVMHRMLAMIRTGREFGPAPADVLAAPNPPVAEDHIEFVSREDPSEELREVTRIERRASEPVEIGGQTVQLRGPFALWVVTETTIAGNTTRTERPLLDGVINAQFFLRFTRGPRLVRATIDLMVSPSGSQFARWDGTEQAWVVSRYNDNTRQWEEERMNAVVGEESFIRLVASTGPRGEW